MRLISGLVIVLLSAGAAQVPSSPLKATLKFQNSGSIAAQPAFLRGVIALHNFDFERAAEAFQEAQKIDPAFALAYWGEAMSHNHPLWNEQDVAAARSVLLRLGATQPERLAKAPTELERDFLSAAETLFFGEGDKAVRDARYAEDMGEMYRRHPNDDEVATLYALSLLGSLRRGETGFRRQAEAAAIAQQVFVRNQAHPGAAHYLIHAYDDPDHAPLGATAARVYAQLAPDAPHPIHMPSHIFVQLGQWKEVAASNTRAYTVATELVRNNKSVEGRDDFHALSWLAYARYMLGQNASAEEALLIGRRAAERSPSNNRVVAGYRSMWARHVIETGRWNTPLWREGRQSENDGASHNNHQVGAVASMPQLDVTFATGVVQARRGNMSAAMAEVETLRAMTAAATKSGADTHRLRLLETTLLSLQATIADARGNVSEALALGKAAAASERQLRAPFGPPDPLKPAHELYGELLLAHGQPAAAAEQFAYALQRTPRRTPSMWGRARAAAAAGDTATARRTYAELAAMLRDTAEDGFAPLRDATTYLATQR